MRKTVSVHSVAGKLIWTGSNGMGVSHAMLQRRAIRLLSELMSKAHDHIFRVVSKKGLGLACADLRRQKLREPIDMLVLGLLGRARMDASSRSPGPGATTGS